MKWLLVAALVVALGCSPMQPALAPSTTYALDGAALVIAALDAVQAARLATMAEPTVDELTVERRRVKRLREARDLLREASKDVERARALALTAVTLLEAAAAELIAAGEPVPHETWRALSAARAWLEAP